VKFKPYMEYVARNIPADSVRPTDIVQALACLIASRLSAKGSLPASCGTGNDLDMDIVQAGILAGLEKLNSFDASKGTLKQYLYTAMAGAMHGYAWERENRVADSRPRVWPSTIPITEDDSDIESALIDYRTTEAEIIAEEDQQTAREAISAAIDNMPAEDMAMLLRDAKIGYNAALRQAWANEIGVTVAALSTRLSRLRRKAREWALSVQ